MTKKSIMGNLYWILDIIGFGFVITGASIIRFSKDELLSIMGGFVVAGGLTLLGISRWISK